MNRVLRQSTRFYVSGAIYSQKWILPDFSFAQKFPLKHKNLGKFYTEWIYGMKSLRDVDPMKIFTPRGTAGTSFARTAFRSYSLLYAKQGELRKKIDARYKHEQKWKGKKKGYPWEAGDFFARNGRKPAVSPLFATPAHYYRTKFPCRHHGLISVKARRPRPVLWTLTHKKTRGECNADVTHVQCIAVAARNARFPRFEDALSEFLGWRTPCTASTLSTARRWTPSHVNRRRSYATFDDIRNWREWNAIGVTRPGKCAGVMLCRRMLYRKIRIARNPEMFQSIADNWFIF